MVDWLTWPAELVLSARGLVASWFVSKDSLSFVALQMGFALVYWRPSCPCLHICQCWLDIGGRVHALPSPCDQKRISGSAIPSKIHRKFAGVPQLSHDRIGSAFV